MHEILYQDAQKREERLKERAQKSEETSPFRPTLTSKNRGDANRGNVYERLYKDAEARQKRQSESPKK